MRTPGALRGGKVSALGRPLSTMTDENHAFAEAIDLVTKMAGSVTVVGPTLTWPCSTKVTDSFIVSAIFSLAITTGSRRLGQGEGQHPMSVALSDLLNSESAYMYFFAVLVVAPWG